MGIYYDWEDEKEKEFRERTKENQDLWKAADSIGDTQTANFAHEQQKKNVEEWDNYTGGESIYDEATGKWNFSKPKEKTAEERFRTREFKYNVYDDPLYQQYIASARRNGQNAMTDTVAKVASQTGGIAGSYAVAAGAGAYNDYMQRANDVIPELEQIAYQKYQDDLARDLKIYEMDEAKRLEDAQYNATLSTHQNYGRPHTDEEKVLIHANGGYITPDGDIVDANGNLIKRGTKYDEEVAAAKAEEEAKTIKEASDKANNAIVNYMLGNDLKSEDILMLLDLGYNYANGILYDPFGNAVEQSYKKTDLASEDKLKTAINALRYKKTLSDSHIQALTTAGFGYNGKGWFNADGVNALDFFDTPEGTVSSEPAKPPEGEEGDDTAGGGKNASELLEEKEKTYNTYVNLFYGSLNKFLNPNLSGNKFSYDFALTKKENAALFVASLDVSEAEKDKIFEKIMAEEK
jgi:hypothetical protein